MWHCADIKASFEFILPGLSVHLASARESIEHHKPALAEPAGAASAAAPSSASSEVETFVIPTMSFQEFEQDSQDSRNPQQDRSISRSASSRAPTKPLPMPAADVERSLEAPSKTLPPLPNGSA